MAETNSSDNFPPTYLHDHYVYGIAYVQSELQTTLFQARLVHSYDAFVRFVTSLNIYSFDWLLLAKEIKESQTLEIFRNIKAIPLHCSYKLCKSFIVSLGFL